MHFVNDSVKKLIRKSLARTKQCTPSKCTPTKCTPSKCIPSTCTAPPELSYPKAKQPHWPTTSFAQPKWAFHALTQPSAARASSSIRESIYTSNSPLSSCSRVTISSLIEIELFGFLLRSIFIISPNSSLHDPK